MVEPEIKGFSHGQPPSWVVPLSWGLLAFCGDPLPCCLPLSTFSSVLSLSPLRAKRRGISWQGARDAAWLRRALRQGLEQGGAKLTQAHACVSDRECQGVTFEPGAPSPSCLSSPARALSTLGSVTTQAPAPSPIRAPPCLPRSLTPTCSLSLQVALSLVPLTATSGASQSHLSQC